MGQFLTAAGNIPFLAALVLMLLIGVVEAVGLGGGMALGDGFDADADVHGDASLLSWINVGRLPLLMLIVVFLFSFGVIGLLGQQLFATVTGKVATAWIAVPLAAFAALPITRVFGRVVSRILPADETTAVSRESLVGRLGVIVTGTASPGNAAQARVRDVHGQPHYVMVEPDDDESFEQGASVLLVRQAGAKYFAIRNTSISLRDAIV